LFLKAVLFKALDLFLLLVIFVHGFGDPMEVSFITMEITTIHMGENNMFLEQKKPGPHFF